MPTPSMPPEFARNRENYALAHTLVGLEELRKSGMLKGGYRVPDIAPFEAFCLEMKARGEPEVTQDETEFILEILDTRLRSENSSLPPLPRRRTKQRRPGR